MRMKRSYGQWFGRIQMPDGQPMMLMLCIDIDRPDELMFYLPNGRNSRGLLTKVERQTAGRLKVKPYLLYRAQTEGPGLFVPNMLTEEETAFKENAVILLNRGSSGGWHGTWKNGAHSGSIELDPPSIPKSVNATKCGSWDDFKKWTKQSIEQDGIGQFRGHGSNKFRLSCTVFRSGLYRQERYVYERLPQFAAHLEAVRGERLSLQNKEDFYSILALGQHHGFPTPMLDWTESPYIAAYFAFAEVIDNERIGRTRDGHIRVYGLARRFTDHPEISPSIITLGQPAPFVNALQIGARGNSRLYAQQGRFLVTNVADLETYLVEVMARSKDQFLVAADVPYREVVEAMTELRLMGLTAASMFPGLDGVAKMMRHDLAVAQRKSQR